MFSSCPLVVILLFSILGAALTNANDSSSRCSLCLNGEEINPLFGAKPIFGSATITIPDCNALLSIVALTPEDTIICVAFRFLATYCGCSRPENSCQVCPPAKPVMKNKDTEIESLDVGFLPEDTQVALSFLSNNVIVSCEQLDSAMTTWRSDDPTCSSMHEGGEGTLQTLCGCTAEEEATIEEPGRNSCSFCVGGQDLPYIPAATSIHFLDPESEPISCQSLFELSLETEPDSGLCTSIQEHSYSCGCPPARNESAVSSCSICNGTTLLNKESFLVVDGIVTNCQNYEAKLRATLPDEECVVADDIVDQCGSALEDQQAESCSICPGGESIGLPDKDITSVVSRLLVGISDISTYTCGLVQASLAFESKDSNTCRSVHLLSKICGCPPRENSCSLCGASGNIMTKPDAQFILGYNDVIGRRSDIPTVIYDTGPTFDSYLTNELITCELADSAMNYVLSEDDPEMCFPLQLSNSHHCGCSPPNTKGVAMLWTQRSFAIVSMIGSLLIILFILLWDKKKRFITYNQILLGISSFDFINSFALALGSLPAPANLGIYGSQGNIHTCRLQGSMYQLGLTSIFYNVILSSYFYIVIKHGWTERKFKKVSKWVHVTALAVGFGMAFGSIPFHQGHLRWCYINRPPVEDSYVPAIMFFVAPVSVAILVITIFTVLMVSFVVRRERKTLNRSMRMDRASSLSRRTFWQSLMYLLAFYLVWPLMFASYLVWMGPETYWLFMLTAVLGPSQGLFNAIVFFHRKRGALSKMFQRIRYGKKQPQTRRNANVWGGLEGNSELLHDTENTGTTSRRASLKSSLHGFSRRFSSLIIDISTTRQRSPSTVPAGGSVVDKRLLGHDEDASSAAPAVAPQHNPSSSHASSGEQGLDPEAFDGEDVEICEADVVTNTVSTILLDEGRAQGLNPQMFDGEDDGSILEEPNKLASGNCDMMIVRNETNNASEKIESEEHEPPRERPALSAIQGPGSGWSFTRAGRSGRSVTKSGRSIAKSGRSIIGSDRSMGTDSFSRRLSKRISTVLLGLEEDDLSDLDISDDSEDETNEREGQEPRKRLAFIQGLGSSRSIITKSGRSIAEGAIIEGEAQQESRKRPGMSAIMGRGPGRSIMRSGRSVMTKSGRSISEGATIEDEAEQESRKRPGMSAIQGRGSGRSIMRSGRSITEEATIEGKEEQESRPGMSAIMGRGSGRSIMRSGRSIITELATIEGKEEQESRPGMSVIPGRGSGRSIMRSGRSVMSKSGRSITEEPEGEEEQEPRPAMRFRDLVNLS